MLSAAEQARYARQIALPGVGPTGQERLLAARVDVRASGPAADALRDYLAAAGVTLGAGEGSLVVASSSRPGEASYVLSESGFARTAGRPCAACLGVLLSSQPPVPDAYRAAVALTAGSLAAADLLSALATPGPREALALVVWPAARRLAPVAREGCGCG